MLLRKSKVLRRETFGIGGDLINWLLGYETVRFKQFLKSHGSEEITSIEIGRVPLSKAIRFGFDLLTSGKFEEAHKKLGVDNFFHLFLVINGKYLLEKNQDVTYHSYHAVSNEEKINVPLHGQFTINELIEKASKGNEKAFWGEYSPLSNNCQAWVSIVLSKNGLQSETTRSFVNQDMKSLLESLPDYTSHVSSTITDVASVINRILQLTTGGKFGYSIGNGDLGLVNRRKGVLLPERRAIHGHVKHI